MFLRTTLTAVFWVISQAWTLAHTPDLAAYYMQMSAVDPEVLRNIQTDGRLSLCEKKKLCLRVMEAQFLETFIQEGFEVIGDPNLDGLFAGTLAAQLVQASPHSLSGIDFNF